MVSVTLKKNFVLFSLDLDTPLDKSILIGKIAQVQYAGIAQLVERNLAKVEVASSSLVSRSILWLSGREAMQRFAKPYHVGSNPASA